MSLCDTSCDSCIGFSLFFGLINYIIILFFFHSGNECEIYKIIFGIILFFNSIFVFIIEGIKKQCSGEWDADLEIIKGTVECKCEFHPNLDHVLLIGIISGCCLCHVGNDHD